MDIYSVAQKSDPSCVHLLEKKRGRSKLFLHDIVCVDSLVAHPGKVHTQLELREKMQDDTTFFLHCSQVLFLSCKGVFLLLFRVNVFLLLDDT